MVDHGSRHRGVHPRTIYKQLTSLLRVVDTETEDSPKDLSYSRDRRTEVLRSLPDPPLPPPRLR